MLDSVKKMLGGKGHIDVKKVEEAVSLGEMELIHFDFYPMSRKIEPKYDAVIVKSLNITADGVYAQFNVSDNSNRDRDGAFVGKITNRGTIDGWSGLFNTRAEAEQCFKDTMAAWKANIP